MKKRNNKWQLEVDDAINQYETKTEQEYSYYVKLNKRGRLRLSKGFHYYFTWMIRIILGLVMIYFTLKSYLN